MWRELGVCDCFRCVVSYSSHRGLNQKKEPCPQVQRKFPGKFLNSKFESSSSDFRAPSEAVYFFFFVFLLSPPPFFAHPYIERP